MSLSSEEIAVLVRELEGAIEGSRLDNVWQSDDHTVTLALHAPGRDRLLVLFSTRAEVARFHLVSSRPPALASPPPFAAALRGRLVGSRLVRLRQVSGDRVLELTFEDAARPEPAGDGDAPPDEPDREGSTPATRRARRRGAPARLIFEVRGRKGNLTLVGPGGEIIASLHPLQRSRGPVQSGEAYRFPEARAQPSLLREITSRPWRFLAGDGAVGETGAGAEADAFPFHAAVASRYERYERREIIRERRESLMTALRRGAVRRARVIEKVRQDLEGASLGDSCRRAGELLKGSFHLLHRGMSYVEVDDYYQDGAPKVRIELDPALGPQENVEKYFRRYRKCQRAVPFITERLRRLEEEARLAEGLMASAESAETLEAILALEASASGLVRKTAPARAKGAAAPERLGPRRFQSVDGLEILVGRNARGNDDLTLRIGRGNDTFLHVAGRAGAHVVVRHAPGKSVPLETLLDAATLALYYSLPERSRGAALAGAAADVDYTSLKHVRKPKGLKPGTVLLADHKTLRVRIDPERLDRLRRGGEDA